MTTPTTVQVRLQIRADTAANWASVNPVLLANELGLESDTKKFKVGNGSSAWNSLAYFPSIVSGGTVLGNLEIGTTGTLTFEGSTADGFETTLGVVDPTADRTILLPNQSGTVVVGGNASITNADIATNAEIAVSKLADGAARQLLQTDAAGTGVEWTDNVDIPGTLDVTGAATFDAAVTVAGDLTVNGTTTTISTQNLLVEDKNIIIGDVATPTDTTADGGGITLKGATDKTINWVDSTDAWTSSERFSLPLGSASAPSLTFTGDPNTGIYSPGADQVAISTGGSGRLFINSSGSVGIGTSSASTNVEINAALDTGASLGLNEGQLSIGREANSGGAVRIGYDTTNNFGFISSGRVGTSWDRLILNAGGGNVGIGTTSPGGSQSALLHVVHSGACPLTIDGTSAGGGYLTIENNGTAKYFIGSGAQLGGGTVSELALRAQTGGGITFLTNGANERARIDSSGRLLVGTSSARANMFNSIATSTLGIEAVAATTGAGRISVVYNDNSSDGSSIIIGKSRATSVGGSTVVQSGDALGGISWQGADGTELVEAAFIRAEVDGTPGANDMPGRLLFSVTRDGEASPNEAVRIQNTREIETFVPSGINNATIRNASGAGTTVAFLSGLYGSTSPATGGTVSLRIWTNGNIQNANNSYTAISDIKLKENVIDAGSQWADLKALRVRNYNLKEGQTHKQIGLIAQEVEPISPGLVYESPDRDEDGNDLGTVTKSVNYSVLYMKAVKALQEAMERIETLEAKVAALESA